MKSKLLEEATSRGLKRKYRKAGLKSKFQKFQSFRKFTRGDLFKNKKIIVTGGMGFIGSHLTEKLLEDDTVTAIGNESTGKIENIKNQLDHTSLTIIKGSIVDPNSRPSLW